MFLRLAFLHSYSTFFVSNNIQQELKVQEKIPPIVNQQSVVYKFQCDLCDASYVGDTLRHLHLRAVENIGKHYNDKHCVVPKDLDKPFFVVTKCNNKFVYLVNKKNVANQRIGTIS